MTEFLKDSSISFQRDIQVSYSTQVSLWPIQIDLCNQANTFSVVPLNHDLLGETPQKETGAYLHNQIPPVDF